MPAKSLKRKLKLWLLRLDNVEVRPRQDTIAYIVDYV